MPHKVWHEQKTDVGFMERNGTQNSAFYQWNAMRPTGKL